MKNNIRYIARLKIETQSALSVGSGDKGLVIDRLIARDANGLPYIPGTSLAGVIRHEFEDNSRRSEEELNQIFGYQKPNEDEGRGGRIIFTSAMMLASDNKQVHEGLDIIDFEKEDYYRFSKHLAERDHVRINHKGTAIDHHKYEEELVRKGTRFVFEIELIGNDSDENFWKEMLAVLQERTFRIGSGTRKGFGQFDVIKGEGHTRQFNLTNSNDLHAYLNKNSSLNQPLGDDWKTIELQSTLGENWIQYNVTLTPDDFFLFGAGIGDINESEIENIKKGKNYTSVDNSPKTEEYFEWKDEKPHLVKKYSQLLIPATSVKGALAHRTAFYYNQKVGNTLEQLNASGIDKIEQDLGVSNWGSTIDLGTNVEALDYDANSPKWESLMEEIENMDFKKNRTWRIYQDTLVSKAKLLEESVPSTGEENKAVKALFGYAKQPQEIEERKIQNTIEEENGARGKVIFSDVYKTRLEGNEKIFNHVAIDRFTGGGRDGALFQEKVVTVDEIAFDIYVEQDAFEDDNIRWAFEKALDDLKTGQLQLGGNTTKGHGAFQGDWTKTKTPIA